MGYRLNKLKYSKSGNQFRNEDPNGHNEVCDFLKYLNRSKVAVYRYYVDNRQILGLIDCVNFISFSKSMCFDLC